MRKDEPVGGAPRSGWKPVLGLSDEPRDQVAGPDWRDWASRTLPGTVFDQLAPQFVAVMNIDGDAEGIVRRGNERVLRARFNDARFFWETDQKKKLADRRRLERKCREPCG